MSYCRATTSGVDYLEHQCGRERRRQGCDYERQEGRDFEYADIQVVVGGAEECGELCDSTSAFKCRSYTFFRDSGTCR